SRCGLPSRPPEGRRGSDDRDALDGALSAGAFDAAPHRSGAGMPGGGPLEVRRSRGHRGR
ncbi:hypothetical protein, partial [Streptomyces sp. NPDC059814]|uniref:hypothetical protein n=1 Tax=Streptomyces sp. NPDC059814 TaxID=3346959 RepID=UPI0036528B56